MSDYASEFPTIVELNVGGVFYTTSLSTLVKEPDSLLSEIFNGKTKNAVVRDSKGKYFIDRDGVLFRYILDYLRNQKLILPENFHERDRLKREAEYFNLSSLVKILNATTPRPAHLKPITPPPASNGSNAVSSSPEGNGKGCGVIVVGYRGTFAFGRDGLADIKFRKLSRILVCGKVNLCREVFGDTLNESRDPDRGEFDRYTSRYFLKHNFLEQAFDMAYEAGFRLISSCGSGTNSAGADKQGESEETRWNHYNEFVFYRE